jgi:hypothetical protein
MLARKAAYALGCVLLGLGVLLLLLALGGHNLDGHGRLVCALAGLVCLAAFFARAGGGAGPGR